jgi:hypothetical protein
METGIDDFFGGRWEDGMEIGIGVGYVNPFSVSL